MRDIEQIENKRVFKLAPVFVLAATLWIPVSHGAPPEGSLRAEVQGSLAPLELVVVERAKVVREELVRDAIAELAQPVPPCSPAPRLAGRESDGTAQDAS